jgi:hypothetical protein
VNLALVRGAEPPHVNKYGEKYKIPTTTYRQVQRIESR